MAVEIETSTGFCEVGRVGRTVTVWAYDMYGDEPSTLTVEQAGKLVELLQHAIADTEETDG